MSRKASRDKSRNRSRNKSRTKRLSPLASLVGSGSDPFGDRRGSIPAIPDLLTGPQPNGSWVVGSGQIINPAGTQVDLGIRVRAKAVALNPNLATHTAAVLVMGATQSVEVFDTKTGTVIQNYIPFGLDPSGSYSGIAYTSDGNTWCSARTAAMSLSRTLTHRAC